MSRRHGHEARRRTHRPIVRAQRGGCRSQRWRCGLVAGLLVLLAGPARAGVDATPGDGARAGGGPVSVAFLAEAESPTAGIAGVKTLLPAGVPRAGISLTAGPPGWTLTVEGDAYDVGGPALTVGTDAEFTISISRLPVDRTELTFKTLVRYSDGNEEAWIEEPTQGDPAPVSPAPTITVAPAIAPGSGTGSPAPSPTDLHHAGPRAEGGLPVWVLLAGLSFGGGILAIGWAYARQIGPD